MNSHHSFEEYFLFTAHGIAGKDRKVFKISRGNEEKVASRLNMVNGHCKTL